MKLATKINLIEKKIIKLLFFKCDGMKEHKETLPTSPVFLAVNKSDVRLIHTYYQEQLLGLRIAEGS